MKIDCLTLTHTTKNYENSIEKDHVVLIINTNIMDKSTIVMQTRYDEEVINKNKI